MREDFKYPYRIITRKEEIESNEALGSLFGTMFILIPYSLMTNILSLFLPKIVINILWTIFGVYFIGGWLLDLIIEINKLWSK
jgi:hypothetical protein